MKDTSRRSNFEGSIVNVSSEGHKVVYPEGIRFDKINDEAGYFNYFAYGQSKLANILHANELSRRFKEEAVMITANSLHPGFVSTNLFQHSFFNVLSNGLRKIVMKNVQQGAATTCYVALHPRLKGVAGKYFSNSNLATASDKASDTELAKKLWDFSLRMVSA